MLLPRNRPPTRPGEILKEEFLEPLGITQTEFAEVIGVSYPRLNEIVRPPQGDARYGAAFRAGARYDA